MLKDLLIYSPVPTGIFNIEEPLFGRRLSILKNQKRGYLASGEGGIIILDTENITNMQAKD